MLSMWHVCHGYMYMHVGDIQQCCLDVVAAVDACYMFAGHIMKFLMTICLLGSGINTTP